MRAGPAGLEGEVCSQHSHESRSVLGPNVHRGQHTNDGRLSPLDVSVTGPKVDEQDRQSPSACPTESCRPLPF